MAVTLSHVHHFGILVSDMARSRDFYDKLFGMQPSMRTVIVGNAGFGRMVEADGAAAQVTFYDLANVSVELIEVTSPRGPRAADGDSAHVAGSKHLCFQVDDFDATYRAMVADGHSFTAEPLAFGSDDPQMAGVVAAYFRDPDGNLLEIVMDPKKPLVAAGQAPP